MKLTPEQSETARAILRDGPNHFTALARRAGLDPATAWIDADLRGITLVAEDDVSGYVFLRTDLRGADLRLAAGKDRATFRDVILDETTLGLPGATDFVPPDDYMDQVKAMILRGEAPPAEWVPFITRLEISEPEWWRPSKERLAFSDLRPLAGLTALTSLDLAGTQVSDVGPLAGLTALTSLNLGSTRVSDVGPLAGLTALTSLDLAGTPVSDVGPLSGMTALTSLDLAGTPVSDVGPLAGMTALTSLDLAGTEVSDVGPLAGMTALTSLDLRGTRVNDVGPLSGLTSLRDLYVDRSKVRNLDALRHLARLWIHDRNHPFETRPQPAMSGLHRAPSGALAPLRRAARRVASWFVR